MVLSGYIYLCIFSGNSYISQQKSGTVGADWQYIDAGEPVALTRKENGILEYLLLNQGRPVSQEELIEHVWDASVDSFSGSIRVHMSSLRKKLKAVLGYDPIVNKIGEGYRIGEDLQ